MVTREDVLTQAVDDCMKELYSYAQPHVEWEDFKKQCEEYTKKYQEWEVLNRQSKLKPVEHCGPRPYEFYYVPADFMRSICDSYVHAYKIDTHQELVDTVQVLKDYFKEPRVDKYIEDHTDEHGNWHPGYRSYDHPANLKQQISNMLGQEFDTEPSNMKAVSEEVYRLVEKFFDMAVGFFNWNRELNSFNLSVYMGPSPCSNKERVIENWKKYRGEDITIDESLYKDNDDEDYFDEYEEVDDNEEEAKED